MGSIGWMARQRRECCGHVAPENNQEHFASRCFFLVGSRCSRTKSIGNFSEAVGTAAVIELYNWPAFNARLAKRFCESSGANGSDSPSGGRPVLHFGAP
jgi:hypothetical protein